MLLALSCAAGKFTAHGLATQRHRYRARVAYDGTSFQGFQIQQGSNRRTVQEEVEQVLSQRLNQDVRVVAAGRTGTLPACLSMLSMCVFHASLL